MEAIIEASGLEKRFGRVRAVDGLDLTIHRGDVFGFLGPNGAGKSTTIRMIVGLVRPTHGKVRVFGQDVWRDRRRALSKVGALVESPALYKYLTGRQNLWILSELSGGVEPEAVDKALRMVGLLERADDKVKSYSHGMRQRLGIAQALVCGPELVILDEPTSGLDPEGMREVRDLIRNLASEHGMTVFLSSHLLHEVEQVCTRVAVIDRGKQIALGSVSELLSSSGRTRIMVDKPTEAARALHSLDYVKVNKITEREIIVETRDGRISDVNRFLVTSGFAVSGLVPVRTSLEEFYFSKMECDGDNADKA